MTGPNDLQTHIYTFQFAKKDSSELDTLNEHRAHTLLSLSTYCASIPTLVKLS